MKSRETAFSIGEPLPEKGHAPPGQIKASKKDGELKRSSPSFFIRDADKIWSKKSPHSP
jgi:hypothetical protein